MLTIGTASIATAMAEVRKFNVGITAASQTLFGLSERTRAAILGTVATLAAFRIGPDDGALIAARFGDVHRDFNAGLFNELETGEAVVKIAGREARRIHTPAAAPALGNSDIVRRQALRHYARDRGDVEPFVLRALRDPSTLTRRSLSSTAS